MKPNKIRKAYAELFLAERAATNPADGAEDARQEIVAVLRRLQTELEHIGGLAAEQGDAATMAAAQDLLDRTVWIKAAVNRDLLAYLDSAADLAEAHSVVADANDRLAKIANGTARAIKRYEGVTPVLGALEKLIGFVKEH